MLVKNKNKLKSLSVVTATLGLTTMGATALIANNNNMPITITQAINGHRHPIIVHAAEVTSIPSHTYGVDVSSYNNTDLTQYARQGAKYAIVKLSEGTTYVNPKAQGQISSAKQNNMLVQGYHYATFGSNVQQAHLEAQYAIQNAHALGLSKGAYLACDYESTDNNPSGDKNANTQAVLAFMHDIANAGYQPLAYSSASFFNQYLNKAQIIAQFPNHYGWLHILTVVMLLTMPTLITSHLQKVSCSGSLQANRIGMHVDGDINVLPMQNKGAVVNNRSTTF